MTTRTAHTPGPWKISHHGQIVACDVRETMISTVISDRDGALIAAAPELLEALKDATDMLHGSGNDEEICSEENLCQFCQLIAKAEGRTT